MFLQKKMVIEQAGQISAYKATLLFLDSRRFHRIARGLDTFFKVIENHKIRVLFPKGDVSGDLHHISLYLHFRCDRGRRTQVPSK